MHAKKAATEKLIKLLRDEHCRCESKLRANRYNFQRLTEEQTILKREKVQLTELINSLTYNLKAQ